MSIQRVYDAALELADRLEIVGLPYCFIGGVAVQRWGEPRLTVDADATVITDFEHDEKLIDILLENFAPRREGARSFALRNRILLIQAKDGTALDVALGAVPFEKHCVARATLWLLEDGRALRTCTAEDLIVHKAFAARGRDWLDIEGVLSRHGNTLDLRQVRAELAPLVELKEEPQILTRLEAMVQRFT